MVTPELIAYLQKQLAAGQSPEDLKRQLASSGWQTADIDTAFNHSGETPTPTAPQPDPSSPRLPGPVDLLRQSLAIYRRRFTTLLPILTIPGLAIVLLIPLLSIGLPGLSGLFTSLTGDSLLSSIGLIGLALILFLVYLVIQTWSQIALLIAIAGHQANTGFRQAFREARSKIFAYGWLMFLSGLTIFGGLLFFLLPGLLFSFWFLFDFWVLIDQNERGMAALLKSREYVRGRMLAVVGRSLALLFFLFLLIILPAIVLELFKLNTIRTVFNFLASLFAGPLALIYYYLIYSHLKNLKDLSVFTPTKKAKLTLVFFVVFGVLVVPVSIGLVIFLVINPAKMQKSARDAARTSDLQLLQNAVEQYQTATGTYPEGLENLIPEYLSRLPFDPSTGEDFTYHLQPNGRDYEICVPFETKPRGCVSHDLFPGSDPFLNSPEQPGLVSPSPTTPPPATQPASACHTTGCSGELCVPADQNINTACLYQPEYACFRLARCEIQPDDTCGWTITPEAKECLNQVETRVSSASGQLQN